MMAATDIAQIATQASSGRSLSSMSEGLPLSLQIMGPPFDEAAVFRASRAFEREVAWVVAPEFRKEIPGAADHVVIVARAIERCYAGQVCLGHLDTPCLEVQAEQPLSLEAYVQGDFA